MSAIEKVGLTCPFAAVVSPTCPRTAINSPCPPRARKEGHPRRLTVIHGATGIAPDLCNRRSYGPVHLLCKQGVGGSSPPSSTCENDPGRILKEAIDTSWQSFTAGSGFGAVGRMARSGCLLFRERTVR